MASIIGSLSRRRLLKAIQGLRVDRAESLFPATTTTTIFTVSGGRILLLGIMGEITEATPATPTTSAKLIFAPTVGAATDMTGAATMHSRGLGSLMSMGTYGGAMYITGAGGTGLDEAYVLSTGDIRLNTTDSLLTGKVKWTVWYQPLDPGAKVVAA